MTTPSGCVGLSTQVRVCHRDGCLLEGVPQSAEAEGRWDLPEHELGLDVLALIGAWCHREHRGVPEIHALPRQKGVATPRAHLHQRARPLRRTRQPRVHRAARAVNTREARVRLPDGFRT